MKTQKKLSREEMKNVTGGIPEGDQWVFCSVDGVTHMELHKCGDNECNTGSLVSVGTGNGC